MNLGTEIKQPNLGQVVKQRWTVESTGDVNRVEGRLQLVSWTRWED